MTLTIPTSLALAIVTRMVRLSDRRRQINSEEDFNEVVQLMLDYHPDFFIVPETQWVH